MADIKINDLKPAGSDLFTDDEDFLSELGNDEMSMTVGGFGLSGGINSTYSVGCQRSTISYQCGGGAAQFELLAAYEP